MSVRICTFKLLSSPNIPIREEGSLHPPTGSSLNLPHTIHVHWQVFGFALSAASRKAFFAISRFVFASSTVHKIKRKDKERQKDKKKE